MKERELQLADAATLDQRETELFSELEEMPAKLEEAYQSLFNLRFRQATRQLEDTSQLRKARKEIARLKTADREMRFELAVIDAMRRERAG
jgi:large subunit ribosomal protein L29